MKKESFKQSNGTEGREVRETKVFYFVIDEKNRWIHFAGTKDDVLDFMARLMACSIVSDPDQERYARSYRHNKLHIEQHVDEWLADEGSIRNSYEFTAQPFRLYARPSGRMPEYLLKKFKEKPTGDKWFVKMLTNSSEHDDESKRRTWKEVKDNFERVRQEIIAAKDNS